MIPRHYTSVVGRNGRWLQITWWQWRLAHRVWAVKQIDVGEYVG